MNVNHVTSKIAHVPEHKQARRSGDADDGRESGGVRRRTAIITADDFGFSPEANAGIIRAHREGVLTGTSLMVAAAAREQAAALARDNPALDVGLHLVVCRGFSVLSAQRLAGIVDSERRFGENPVLAGMRYFFNRRVRALLCDEMRAQIETHLKLVGALNHIDGHLNFHVHPAIANMLIDLAAEYRVPWMRLPREPVFTTLALARDHALRKLVEATIFRTLSRRARRLMASRGIRMTDWLFGLHQTGHITEDYVAGVIARMPAGLTEFYFHPAEHAENTAARREVAVLTSVRIRDALAAANVRLTNFAELARN